MVSEAHSTVSQQVSPTRAATQRSQHVVSHDKPGSVRLEASVHHLFCLNLFSEPGLGTVMVARTKGCYSKIG